MMDALLHGAEAGVAIGAAIAVGIVVCFGCLWAGLKLLGVLIRLLREVF